jgi:hypothetical protein
MINSENKSIPPIFTERLEKIITRKETKQACGFAIDYDEVTGKVITCGF